MNLLLLLSALMSALCATGASAQSRAPQAVSRSVVAERAALVAVVALVRHPEQRVPGLVSVALSRAETIVGTPVSAPLYASRRRE